MTSGSADTATETADFNSVATCKMACRQSVPARTCSANWYGRMAQSPPRTAWLTLGTRGDDDAIIRCENQGRQGQGSERSEAQRIAIFQKAVFGFRRLRTSHRRTRPLGSARLPQTTSVGRCLFPRVYFWVVPLLSIVLPCWFGKQKMTSQERDLKRKLAGRAKQLQPFPP